MGSVPTEIQDVHRQLIDDRGFIPAGQHKVQHHGNGLYGVLPSNFCDFAQIQKGDAIKTFVDYDLGAVIHIPESKLEEIDG